jgi:hypothetical protein
MCYCIYRVLWFDDTNPAVRWQADETDTAAKPGRGQKGVPLLNDAELLLDFGQGGQRRKR